MSVPFGRPFFSPDARRGITEAIDQILTSGQLMLGEYTRCFETDFAAYVGTEHAITTNTCTTALQIALMHFDVRDREVLVPAAGFITDISVVRWAGGTPVLVDADPETLAFDPADLRRKVTAKTKGMIWVHLTGLISPRWREIVAFAREHDLFLIEDCAHAHGASVEGIKAGAIGDVGCFSFYPTKVMTTGTGGLMTTNDPSIAKSARELRLFGREGGVGGVVREGNDWFMDEVRAAIGWFQLRDLEAGLQRRRDIARMYTEKLAGLPGIRFLAIPAGHQPSWYHYTVFVDASVDYAKLAKALQEKHGVPTKPIYIPLHQELIFRDLDDGTLKQAEAALNRSLCLPLYVDMTDEQVDAVVRGLVTEIREMQCLAGS